MARCTISLYITCIGLFGVEDFDGMEDVEVCGEGAEDGGFTVD